MDTTTNDANRRARVATMVASYRAGVDASRVAVIDSGSHSLAQALHDGCAAFRQHSLDNETDDDRAGLTGGSYWDLSPKYRLDLLLFDLPKVANQHAMAAAFATDLIDDLADSTFAYYPALPDGAFWYHIDMGIRSAASGWDRVALLLDLAFGTDLRQKWSALRAIARDCPDLKHVDAYKRLKRTRDGLYQELQVRGDSAARDEAVHLLSPFVRNFAEFIESQTNGSQPRQPSEWLESLVSHHAALLEGIEDAVSLVEWRWPSQKGTG